MPYKNVGSSPASLCSMNILILRRALVLLVMVSTAVCLPSYAAAEDTKHSLGPPPGDLIEVGAHKMHIYCVGPKKAGPSIILEAGGGAFSRDWADVQRILSSRLRTCSYDRAGLGWSESGPGPRTMGQEVLELHTLLEKANVRPPYVLVGQSIGGLLVRLYTRQYAQEVAGLVLVDPAEENTLVFSLKRNQWIHFRDGAIGRPIPEPRLAGPATTQANSDDEFMAEETQQMYLARLAHPQQLGDRPLIVLGAGRRPRPPGMAEDVWQQVRPERDRQVKDLAQLSSNSKFVLDPLASHNIQRDDPQLVASAIEEVWSAVVNHTRLMRDATTEPAAEGKK